MVATGATDILSLAMTCCLELAASANAGTGACTTADTGEGCRVLFRDSGSAKKPRRRTKVESESESEEEQSEEEDEEDRSGKEQEAEAMQVSPGMPVC